MAGEPVLLPTPAALNIENEAATLRLRVWTPESVSFHWDGAQPWIAMLRQAVGSSGGVMSGAVAGRQVPLAAEFTSVAAAVRASRRLHALASGYAVESKGQLFGVATLICPNAVYNTAELQHYLERKARPAQTLLALKREAAPPEGVRIEEACLGKLTLYELSYPHREEAAKTAETLLREHRERPASLAPLSPPAPAAKASASLSFLAHVRAGPRSVAAVLAASMAVFAGIAIARRSTTPTVPIVLPAAQPVVQPATATPPPAIPTPVPKTPVASQSPKIDHPRKPLPPDPVDTAEKPKRGRGDLTAEQIRQILTRGQNALDRGCYTEAIGFYRRVLEDDPRNGSATAGQEKAHVRMRLSGENALCSR